MPSAQPSDNADNQKCQRDDDGENSADGQNLEIGHGQRSSIQCLGGDGEVGFTSQQAVEQRDIVFAVDKGTPA